MNYKKIFKRETKVIAYVVIALTLVVIGTSYALFLQVNNNQDNQVVTAGSLVVTYSNGNVVSVKENDENNCLTPQSDETGSTVGTSTTLGGCNFTLSITNIGSLPMQYDLLIYDDVGNTELPSNAKFVSHELVRHSLKKQYSGEGVNPETVTSAKALSELDLKEGKRVLENSTIYVGETITFSLNIWISEEANVDVIGQYVYLKLDVVGSVSEAEYTESILNGTDPVLKGDLIPVEIDETGKVTKANIHSNWYSYEEKKWANAVILNDKSITYQDNQEIPEENIESYFVWIPKYSYQLWDLGTYNSLTSINTNKPHVIPIKFGLTNTNDDNEGECTTPMTSEASGKCKIGDYMTPPAFITMGTNGLWVGKFETGYKGSTAPGNVNNSSLVQIKPNIYSWTNIQVVNMFYTSYNYQRELDSHMMKNTEWGAVAYLQHSAYGSATSVRINNNSAFITGYAAKNEPTTGYTNTNIAGNIQESTSLGVDGTNTYNYKNSLSQVASTTGNYTGIYDMSGGAEEVVMTVMLNSTNTAPLSGRNSTYNSGFNGPYGNASGSLTNGVSFPASKYYETYKYNTNNNNYYVGYNRRILGDGSSEFGPFASATYGSRENQIGSWYMDSSWTEYFDNPWVARGGSYNGGFASGVFCFVHYHGGVNSISGFRIVLAI